MVFNRAYCQQAVCSPSRSSLLTGTRPDTTKVWDLDTHFRTALPDVVTLGQHFKQNGYFVQGMGKIYHGGYDDPPTWSVPWQTPKAITYALPENLDARPAPVRRRAGRCAPKPEAEEERAKPATAWTAVDRQLARPGVRGRRRAGQHLSRTARWPTWPSRRCANMSKKPEPFFLAVGFIKPHLPFVSPKKYWDLYDPAKIQLAPNPFRPKDAPDYAILPGGELRNYHGIPEGSIPDDLARQLKHGYYAADQLHGRAGRQGARRTRPPGPAQEHHHRPLGRPRLETRRARRLVQAQQRARTTPTRR